MTLAGHLTQLESSGLIRLTQMVPDLEYVFRHALIQDAAYRSLVKADRRALHHAVGEVLERASLDRLDEFASLLARHFDEAGDDERALRYFTLAGDAAARQYANAEAVMHYTCALNAARRVPQIPDAARLFAHLYVSLGQALELSAKHADALAHYEDMEALARARGDRTMELAALMARAKVYATLNAVQDPARAQSLLEQALATARTLGDRAAESKILWNLMLIQLWGGGDQRLAVEYGEQALALARRLDLREQIAFTLNDLSYAYMSTGAWSKINAALNESRVVWRERGNLPMLADNLANSVLMYMRAGDFDQAIAAADEAQRISGAIGNAWGQAGSRAYVGLVYLERGEPDRAMAVMVEATQLGEQAGHPAPIVATRADLGWVYASLGAFERGLELTRFAVERAREVRYLRAYPVAVGARLHLARGDPGEAETALGEAHRELEPTGLQWFAPILIPLADAELALARHDPLRAISIMDDLLADLHVSRTRLFVPDALYLKGKALLQLGRTEAAAAMLGEARAEAEALGSQRMLWPILIASSEIDSVRGKDAEARALRDRAREIVGFIADRCPAHLRESFLATSDQLFQSSVLDGR